MRWTKSMIEAFGDDRVIAIILRERMKGLRPYCPLYQRLADLLKKYEDLANFHFYKD